MADGQTITNCDLCGRETDSQHRSKTHVFCRGCVLTEYMRAMERTSS